ncbi:MAG: bifunctional (p)ppGpp synthetase/guanosine-3',5'-bis(diphosphate) 3'-pyrophosphohydrolase [Nanoarchaeota archaeon]|nr:MAG: bifunctional (p)ppGpp synthetase/guanosine-3',5'-bis(diphosphate) 3'-pyrophosphohydrolase [Nanoarchaeota archaeon]
MTVENKTNGMSREEFLADVKKFNPNANTVIIGKAYDFAKEAHRGQMRASGEEHFTHVFEVAYLLAELRLDSDTVAAALLHDVIEDTGIKLKTLQEKFGEEIASLVEGVTKIKPLDLKTEDKAKMQNLRKVILATSKDVRVILIKLIDRLHNMRTLKYLDSQKQHQIAMETLNIYAPIAYKLGMYRIKLELEDLSLRYLDPKIYKEIKDRVVTKKEERDKEVESIIQEIRELLDEKSLKAKVTGRAKSFYSIYKKMKKKGLPFEEIHDLYAIRIIVDNTDECYRALGIIHSNWTPVPKMFDDYIATPKPNLYQSIHTEVIIDGRPVEIQIRTLEMHFQAEDGIAAHWRYHGTERDKAFDKKITWLKQILEWKRTSKDAEEFIESLKVDLFKDQIIVFTPKGDPIPLAEGATPIDFAYMVHTEIGNHCQQAKVNGHIQPLDSELKSGDIVEIVLSRKPTVARHWLTIAKTTSAKEKIRQALQLTKDRDRKAEAAIEISDEQALKRIEAKGIKKSQLTRPKCCKLTYGKEIVGYQMKDGKIAVHSLTCETLQTLDDKRKVRLQWEKEEEKNIYKLKVEIIDRLGLLADVLNILAKNKVNVETINQKMVKDRLVITFALVPKSEHIPMSEVIKEIKLVKNVLSVVKTD